MTTRSETNQAGEPVPALSAEVLGVHERLLGTSPARSRHIEIRSGRRVHVIEAGEGPPIVFLNGTGEPSLSLLTQDIGDADRALCLLERLEGVRAIAVDRVRAE